jgi:hypothetical protein
MLALLLAGPLAFGVGPRCAPPAAHSCCASESSCCCGDAGACTCSVGDAQSPAGPAPAPPQRAGDELRPEPAIAAAVAAIPAAGADGPSAMVHRCEPRAELPPPPDTVVLRC